MSLEELFVQIQEQLAEAARAGYALRREEMQQLIESMGQVIECLKQDLESPDIRTAEDLAPWYDPVHAYMSQEIEQHGKDYLTDEGSFDSERLADKASDHFALYGPETTTPEAFYDWAEELGKGYVLWLSEQEGQAEAAAPEVRFDAGEERV